MKTLSERLNLKNDTAVYAFAVALCLVIVSALLITYYVALRPEQEKYMTISLLDSNKKAVDYPEVLVAGVNSTFSVYVEVENHMGRALDNVQVLVKVTKNLNPEFPVNATVAQTISGALENEGKTQNVSTLTLNEPGEYGVYYELWIPSESGELQFSNDFCVLNLRVVTA